MLRAHRIMDGLLHFQRAFHINTANIGRRKLRYWPGDKRDMRTAVGSGFGNGKTHLA